MYCVRARSRFKLTEPRWISFGGSYSGELAAWVRVKYPHLIYGARSPDGPLGPHIHAPLSQSRSRYSPYSHLIHLLSESLYLCTRPPTVIVRIQRD